MLGGAIAVWICLQPAIGAAQEDGPPIAGGGDLIGYGSIHHPTIGRDGMVWSSWPKKTSKVPTDITEDVIRTVLLPTGLVDVKVAAVDEVWSGLKLVIRKALR